MNIIDYTSAERVFFLKSDTKEDALRELTEKSADCLYESDAFYQTLMEREKLMTTGVGFETAFPHSKNTSVIDFFVTIGISHAGIDWQAFDKKPVKMIFLIGGLVEEQEKYLRILAALSKILSNENYRQNILKAPSTEKFYELFCQLAIKENQAI